MKILNVMKRAGICLGLLLITTIINSNYQYSIAQDDTNSTKSQKSGNKKGHKHKTTKIRKDDIKVIKSMFEAFKELVKDGHVNEKEVTAFYEKYIINDIYKVFGVKEPKKKNRKEVNKKFDNLFIKYVVKLLNSDLMKKINDYTVSDEFKKTKKKNVLIMQCKLVNAKDKNDIIDMVVILKNKDQKVKEFSIMEAFKLVGSAKNIVDKYCEDHNITHDQYRKFTNDKKLEICEKAWAQ